MLGIDFSDDDAIKEELQKLVHREMAKTFDELDRVQAELEALAATLDETMKGEAAAKIETVREGKLEFITLFKAMQDFIERRSAPA
jgi:hypothetical protein